MGVVLKTLWGVVSQLGWIVGWTPVFLFAKKKKGAIHGFLLQLFRMLSLALPLDELSGSFQIRAQILGPLSSLFCLSPTETTPLSHLFSGAISASPFPPDTMAPVCTSLLHAIMFPKAERHSNAGVCYEWMSEWMRAVTSRVHADASCSVSPWLHYLWSFPPSPPIRIFRFFTMWHELGLTVAHKFSDKQNSYRGSTLWYRRFGVLPR